MKQPFEKVVTQHGGTVLRVCRVLPGVHDAEDAWIAAGFRPCATCRGERYDAWKAASL
jgi:methylphosphotriester-DNA--protein-cysteine methyltransferase